VGVHVLPAHSACDSHAWNSLLQVAAHFDAVKPSMTA
jgi:hypothetical protein